MLDVSKKWNARMGFMQAWGSGLCFATALFQSVHQEQLSFWILAILCIGTGTVGYNIVVRGK